MNVESLENFGPCYRWAVAIVTTITDVVVAAAVCVIFIGFTVVGRTSCEGLLDPTPSTYPDFNYVSFIV